MNFDETITELEPLIDPSEPWLEQTRRAEPDLEVDGLDRPLLMRLADLFLGRRR